MYKSLSIEVRDHVAQVTLRTGAKGNALGPDVWAELPQAFAELDANAEVRAVLLRADGPHFTYGLDLPAMMGELMPLMQGGLADTRTRLHRMIFRLQEATNAIARCSKPVVAAIQGFCLGGGLDIITACDVRVCSADAVFGVREVRVAMVADLGTLQRLPRIIGEGHARELALTGEDFDATRAASMGLVTHVAPSHEALAAHARKLALAIAGNPPLVTQGIKSVMNERIRGEDEAGLRFVAAWNAAFLPSADLGEAMAAFLEKRPPSFKGA
jgi:enoyl-CoA hydratase